MGNVDVLYSVFNNERHKKIELFSWSMGSVIYFVMFGSYHESNRQH